MKVVLLGDSSANEFVSNYISARQRIHYLAKNVLYMAYKLVSFVRFRLVSRPPWPAISLHQPLILESMNGRPFLHRPPSSRLDRRPQIAVCPAETKMCFGCTLLLISALVPFCSLFFHFSPPRMLPQPLGAGFQLRRCARPIISLLIRLLGATCSRGSVQWLFAERKGGSL
jgi:hypothetical protein